MKYFSDQPSSLWETLGPTHGHLINGTRGCSWDTEQQKLDFILPSLPPVSLKVAAGGWTHDHSDAHPIFLLSLWMGWGVNKQQKPPSAEKERRSVKDWPIYQKQKSWYVSCSSLPNWNVLSSYWRHILLNVLFMNFLPEFIAINVS